MQYIWQGDEGEDGLWLPHGGILTTYKINPVFSLEGDLLYTESGYYGSGPARSVKYTFRYITIPTLLHFNASDRLSVVVGPEAGFLLSAHYRNWYEYKRIESNYTRWFNLDLSAGLNYKITPNLKIMARYIYGLHGIWSLSDAWTYDNGNRMIQFSVSYTLHKDTARSIFSKPERGLRWFVGLNQGISTSQIDDAYGDDKDLIHYSGGLDVRLEFARYLYVASGITYIQRGGTLAGQNRESIRLNYLTFPVVVGYSPVKTKPLTLSIEGGMAFEALISSQNHLAEDDHFGHAVEHKTIFSLVYGFEASTDAINKLNVFLNYRLIKPFHSYSFVDLYPRKPPNDYYDDAPLEFWSSGKILSIGARVKL